jgi:hypothetical protein
LSADSGGAAGGLAATAGGLVAAGGVAAVPESRKDAAESGAGGVAGAGAVAAAAVSAWLGAGIFDPCSRISATPTPKTAARPAPMTILLAARELM